MDIMVHALIEREMENLKLKKMECEEKLSCCTPYGQEYWRLHDRYEAYVIKIGYLVELRDKIEKVMIMIEEIE